MLISFKKESISMQVKLFQSRPEDLDKIDREDLPKAISGLEREINLFLIMKKVVSVNGPHMQIYYERGVKRVIYTASVVYEEPEEPKRT